MTYEYIYNGGGVGVGDFNNDGLQDLFFVGNIVNNKLYINKGNLRFEDISQAAGVQAPGIWCTSVAVIDINYDGLLDIYLAASAFNEDKRKNILFINEGLNKKGIPVFTDQAKKYGVDHGGYSTNAVFFDYDNDTDMDLFVLTNQVESISPNKYRLKENNGTSPSNDQLFRNNDDGTFTNVTREAGIFYEGYGLGISISDINMDGWKDIYITNLIGTMFLIKLPLDVFIDENVS